MKASKARNVAIETQYSRVTKKIEEACKKGRQDFLYKHGILFDEVVRKLLDDGFSMVRDYENFTATISWNFECENENSGELMSLWPVCDENSCIDYIVFDFGNEIPEFDELVEMANAIVEGDFNEDSSDVAEEVSDNECDKEFVGEVKSEPNDESSEDQNEKPVVNEEIASEEVVSEEDDENVKKAVAESVTEAIDELIADSSAKVDAESVAEVIDETVPAVVETEEPTAECDCNN